MIEDDPLLREELREILKSKGARSLARIGAGEAWLGAGGQEIWIIGEMASVPVAREMLRRGEGFRVFLKPFLWSEFFAAIESQTGRGNAPQPDLVD